MASTFTPNIQLQEPAVGDQVGTWGTLTINPNMTLIDLVAGANTTVSLNNSNVVLSASQFQSRMVTFNSTLTGSVIITFPTSFTKDYIVQNVCTGSSAFTVTLETTAAGQVICVPPGDAVQIYNDGTNINFMNLDRVGAYWDYAGSSLPAWVSGCSPKQPYLVCNGSSFSATLYPALATILGTAFVPDARSKVRVPLDQGANINSSATTGLSSVGTTGGSQTVTLGTSNLPPYTPSGTITSQNDPGPGLVTHFGTGPINIGGTGSGGFIQSSGAIFTGTAQGGVSAPVSTVQPSYIGGITLIRSA